MYPDGYDPNDDLTALENEANKFWADSSTTAFWIVGACAIAVGMASFTEMWYDVILSVIRGTKYPNL